MKVYLVFEDSSEWISCQNGDFFGAFSTREKAEAFIARQAADNVATGLTPEDLTIVECDVDKCG